MARTVRTDIYYYIYSNDEEDMLWYSPSTDDKKKQDQNLLNAIEEVRRILRRDPNADVEIYGRATDMCGEYEDGIECDFKVADISDLDKLELKLKGRNKK